MFLALNNRLEKVDEYLAVIENNTIIELCVECWEIPTEKCSYQILNQIFSEQLNIQKSI